MIDRVPQHGFLGDILRRRPKTSAEVIQTGLCNLRDSIPRVWAALQIA